MMYTINTTNASFYKRILKRRHRGSILLFASILALGVVTVGMMLLSKYQLLLVERARAEHAAKAAAMAGAFELSKIVVADARWGYVSLSDFPACGAGTMAQDNEPLPVSGINTIVATVRTEKLLAQKLDSPALADLSEDDYQEYKRLQQKLQTTLDQAVLPSCRLPLKDSNGKPVNVYKAAYQAFMQNDPRLHLGNKRIKEFSISLGWLADGSTTVTSDNQYLPQASNGNSRSYPSFVNLPVGKDSFYFAGVSNQLRLVEAARFRPHDGKHFCSCLAVKCVLEDMPMGNAQQKESEHIESADSLLVYAAALPCCQHNFCAPGTFVVYLPQGYMPEVSCLADLIMKSEMTKAKAQHALATGDYPSEPRATLSYDNQNIRPIAYSVGRAFFDWLRTCNARPRLDSIVNALNTRFQGSEDISETYLATVYSVDALGQIQVQTIKNAAFMKETIADQQTKDEAMKVLPTSKGMLCLNVRDEVANAGIDCSSKHGAQPLPYELPCAFSQFLSEKEQKEQLAAIAQARGPIRESYRKGGLAAAVQMYCVPADE